MNAKRKQSNKPSLPSKKKKYGPVEEISFDSGAREDFLTGFHKRKVQRAKHAQEQAAKKEREERIATRKAIREERKTEAEDHVKQVNAMLKEHMQFSDASEDDEDNEWGGIEEPRKIDHEDQYEDEDKFTTVTVEAVDVTKEGMSRAKDDDDEGSASEQEKGSEELSQAASKTNGGRTANGKRIWTKEKPDKAKTPAKKKKKFRYESKTERRATRFKERSGNKKKAEERKSNTTKKKR